MDPAQYQELPSQRSRPRLTPSSRRASDQDVVLPSVERESEAPSQKRKSFPYPAREEYPATAYDAYKNHPGHATKRPRPARVVQPHHEVSNLVSNQARPVYSSGRDVYEVARPRAGPADHAYDPLPPRHSPMRDTRGAYGEVVVSHSPRAYAPEYDRTSLHGRRVLPSMDRLAMSGPTARYETRDGPYVRDGASNGYYAPR